MEIERGKITKATIYQEHFIVIQGIDTAELLKNVIVWLSNDVLISVLNVQVLECCQATIRYIDTGELSDETIIRVTNHKGNRDNLSGL